MRRGRGARARGRPADRVAAEGVTEAVDGSNPSRDPGTVVEGGADLGHEVRQVGLGHEGVGPEPLLEDLLAQRRRAVQGERREQVERLRREVHVTPVPYQLTGLEVQGERTELDAHDGPWRKPEWLLDGSWDLARIGRYLSACAHWCGAHICVHRATVYLLVLVVGNGGCSSDRAFRLPTAPTTPPAASAPSAEWIWERWNLTTTHLGAVGLDACPSLGSPPVGAVGHWTLATERSREALFVSAVNQSNRNDHVSYGGTIDGEAFLVTTGVGGGSMTCGDTRVAFRDEQRVTGRFADDGRALVGEEVYSLWLASGATLTWHTEWRATRQ